MRQVDFFLPFGIKRYKTTRSDPLHHTIRYPVVLIIIHMSIVSTSRGVSFSSFISSNYSTLYLPYPHLVPRCLPLFLLSKRSTPPSSHFRPSPPSSSACSLPPQPSKVPVVAMLRTLWEMVHAAPAAPAHRGGCPGYRSPLLVGRTVSSRSG